MPADTHTLIISDVHLGSRISKARELHRMLSDASFKRLIILGDLLDHGNFKRLDRSHWDLLSYLRSLSDPALDKEIVWVRGNHDRMSADTMSQMIGAKVYDEYTWEMAGKRYLAIHGDQFAKAIILDDLLLLIGQKIHPIFQYFDQKARHIVPFIEKFHNAMRRTSSRVARGACKYGADVGVHYVFCGHTHKAYSHEYSEDAKSLCYYNSGSWTRTPQTFVSISSDGKISLEQYTERV